MGEAGGAEEACRVSEEAWDATVGFPALCGDPGMGLGPGGDPCRQPRGSARWGRGRDGGRCVPSPALSARCTTAWARGPRAVASAAPGVGETQTRSLLLSGARGSPEKVTQPARPLFVA